MFAERDVTAPSPDAVQSCTGPARSSMAVRWECSTYTTLRSGDFLRYSDRWRRSEADDATTAQDRVTT